LHHCNGEEKVKRKRGKEREERGAGRATEKGTARIAVQQTEGREKGTACMYCCGCRFSAKGRGGEDFAGRRGPETVEKRRRGIREAGGKGGGSQRRMRLF